MKKNCVFCDRSKFEERLVGENSHFYIIATLGQISDGGHLLLVPKSHIPCIGAMKQKEITPFEEMDEKIYAVLGKNTGFPSR